MLFYILHFFKFLKFKKQIDPDTKTELNEAFNDRVNLYATEDGKPAKSIMFTGYLYSPLRQFESLLPSGVNLNFTFIKANDNRLRNINKSKKCKNIMFFKKCKKVSFYIFCQKKDFLKIIFNIIRLLDWNEKSKIDGKKFQISITDLELHVLR